MGINPMKGMMNGNIDGKNQTIMNHFRGRRINDDQTIDGLLP